MENVEQVEVTTRQKKLICHILSSNTIIEACKKAGVAKVTYYEWLKEDGFRYELKRQRNELIKEALGKLKDSMLRAVNELVSLLDQRISPDLKRLICNDIITNALKSREIEELEDRLDKVERIVLERKTFK